MTQRRGSRATLRARRRLARRHCGDGAGQCAGRSFNGGGAATRSRSARPPRSSAAPGGSLRGAGRRRRRRARASMSDDSRQADTVTKDSPSEWPRYKRGGPAFVHRVLLHATLDLRCVDVELHRLGPRRAGRGGCAGPHGGVATTLGRRGSRAPRPMPRRGIRDGRRRGRRRRRRPSPRGWRQTDTTIRGPSDSCRPTYELTRSGIARSSGIISSRRTVSKPRRAATNENRRMTRTPTSIWPRSAASVARTTSGSAAIAREICSAMAAIGMAAIGSPFLSSRLAASPIGPTGVGDSGPSSPAGESIAPAGLVHLQGAYRSRSHR